jgi:hypothetical protein
MDSRSENERKYLHFNSRKEARCGQSVIDLESLFKYQKNLYLKQTSDVEEGEGKGRKSSKKWHEDDVNLDVEHKWYEGTNERKRLVKWAMQATRGTRGTCTKPTVGKHDNQAICTMLLEDVQQSGIEFLWRNQTGTCARWNEAYEGQMWSQWHAASAMSHVQHVPVSRRKAHLIILDTHRDWILQGMASQKGGMRRTGCWLAWGRETSM